jgi:hypothetical protein
MVSKLIWQQNNQSPDNAASLAKIAEWLAKLEGQEINWQQRLLTANSNREELNWETQKFDEKFVIQTPQLRGITIFWRKPNVSEERNITATKLELDLVRSKLYIYPQSQAQVVICVGIPQVIYQTIEVNNPQIAAMNKENNRLLLLRDDRQQLEVKITLNNQKIVELVENLKLLIQNSND